MVFPTRKTAEPERIYTISPLLATQKKGPALHYSKIRHRPLPLHHAKHHFRFADHFARHLADAFGLGDLAPCAAIRAISNRQFRKPSRAASRFSSHSAPPNRFLAVFFS